MRLEIERGRRPEHSSGHLYRGGGEAVFVNQHIALCRPKVGFNKKYVGYWIISECGGIHHLQKMQKGATEW